MFTKKVEKNNRDIIDRLDPTGAYHVPVASYDADTGMAYFQLAGVTLGQLDYTQLDCRHFLRCLTGIARGLAEMHQAGFCHLDVKLDNVVYDGTACRLIDFETAATLDGSFNYDFLEMYPIWPLEFILTTEMYEQANPKPNIMTDYYFGQYIRSGLFQSYVCGRNVSEICENCIALMKISYTERKRLIYPATDVYSFGVLLMQIVSHIPNMIDPIDATPLFRLALRMTRFKTVTRPTMRECLEGLLQLGF